METSFTPIIQIDKHSGFDYWLDVHTNFDLHEHPLLLTLLSRVTGVDRVFEPRRYEVSVMVGKVFSVMDVADEIKKTIDHYFANRNNYQKIGKFLRDLVYYRIK